MKVNRPGDPLSGGIESLDQRDALSKAKNEKFVAALNDLEAQMTSGTAGGSQAPSATRSALTDIADQFDLANAGQALAAVRESARFMIRSRLNERHRQTKAGQEVVDGLTEFVSADPLLKNRLLGILGKLKSRG